MDNYKFLEFGNRLKYLREQNHIRQGQFADQIGITRQSMSNYESGKHSPDVNVIIKMAARLGCSADYLLGLTEHRNYESNLEFNESLSALSGILRSIPEPLRVAWLDIFIGTAQWIEKDLKGDTQFQHLGSVFFNGLTALINCCLNAKESQMQECYTEKMAQELRRMRISTMLQMRRELDDLDMLSYMCTDQLLEDKGDNLKNLEQQELLNKLAEYLQPAGDE